MGRRHGAAHGVPRIARDAGADYAAADEEMGAHGTDALVPLDHVHRNDAGHAAIWQAFAAAIIA